MKKTILFKTLVDILFVLHIVGLFGILLILPFGVFNFNEVNVETANWSIFNWLILLGGFSAYIVFLKGLYFLRKIARNLLSNKYFSLVVINNIKKSGTHFLLTGILSLGILILLWFSKLFHGKLEFGYDLNLMIPFFLMIIGLFLIIQSNSLFIAKGFKDENDLIV